MTGRRAALVVAAYEFQDPKFQLLRSPARDAEALAEALADPKIGMFEVTTLVNQPCDVVTQELEGFFADRKRDDLLTVYFSCHGVKDSAGRLYFAMANTKFNRLGSTGIPASFLSDQMEYSYSKRIVLLLDCCYSGAFLKGLRPRATDEVHVEELEGRGRAVITASRATEYAFEAEDLTLDTSRPSLFTGAIVEGLTSGKADRDGDGSITVDELYDYVYDHVRQNVSAQTPGKWAEIEGDLVLARNPSPPVRAAELPTELVRAIESESALQRLGAVAVLVEWLQRGSASEALRAKEALSTLADDPDIRVSRAAKMALAAGGGGAKPAETPSRPAPPPPPPPPRSPSGTPASRATPREEPAAETSPTEKADTSPPRPAPEPVATADRPADDRRPHPVSRAAAVPLLIGFVLLVLALFPDFWEAGGIWVSLSSDGKQVAESLCLAVLVAAAACCLLLRGDAPVAGVCLLAGITVPVASILLSLLAHLDVVGERTVSQVGAGYSLAVVGFGLVLVGAAMAILSGRRHLRLDPLPTGGGVVAMVALSALAAALLMSWGPIKLAGGGFNVLVLVVIGLVPLVWLSPPHSPAAGAGGVVRVKLTALILLFAVSAGIFIAASTPHGMDSGAGVSIESASAAAYVIGAAIVLLLAVAVRPPSAGAAVALGFLLASAALNIGGVLDDNRDAGARALFGSALIIGALAALVYWSLRPGTGRPSAPSAEPSAPS